MLVILLEIHIEGGSRFLMIVGEALFVFGLRHEGFSVRCPLRLEELLGSSATVALVHGSGGLVQVHGTCQAAATSLTVFAAPCLDRMTRVTLRACRGLLFLHELVRSDGICTLGHHLSAERSDLIAPDRPIPLLFLAFLDRHP
jgi:hypothetical protein